MSRNVVSFLKRHLFTCHSSSLFHSRKDAVPCDVILYFTQAALLPQSINDSSDLARSSIKKLQSHITLPFTAVFALPSLQEYFFPVPIFPAEKPGRPMLGCCSFGSLSYFREYQTPSLLLYPHRDNPLVKAWPLLAATAISHQGQHQLFATQPLRASCSGRRCHCTDNFFQKKKSTPLRCREPPVINWHSSIKFMLSYTICNAKSIPLCI